MRGAARRWGRIVAAVVVVVGIAVGAWIARRTRPASSPSSPDLVREAPAADSAALAPAGVRVRVEVLNATTTRGLARSATAYLRDLGYDVVANGNAPERRDSTAVVVRRDGGDVREWAVRAARAMGGAAVLDRPDSLRYVDLTVLVGTDWRPPPGPFRP